MSNQMDIDGSHRHDPDLNVPHPPHSKSSRTLDGSASGTSSPAVYITVPEHTLILPYSTSPDFSASTPPFVPHRHQNAISPPSTILGSTSLRPSSPSFHAFPVDSITGVGGVPVAPLPPLPQENRSSPVNEMKTGVARAGGTERSQNGALSTVAASTRLRTSLLKPVRVTRKEGYGMTASHPPPPSPVIGASLEALPAQTVKEDREDAAQKRLSMIAQQQKEYRAVRGSKSSNTSWKLPSVFSGRMGGQTGSSAPIPLGSTVSQAYLAERKRKRRVDVAVASGSATSGWAMFGRQRSGRGRDSQTSGSSLRRFLALTFGIVLGVLGGGLAILQIMGAPMYVLSRFLKPASEWPNPLYSMDPLAPLIYHVHSLLTLSFIAVLGPHLLFLVSQLHQRHYRQEVFRRRLKLGGGSSAPPAFGSSIGGWPGFSGSWLFASDTEDVSRYTSSQYSRPSSRPRGAPPSPSVPVNSGSNNFMSSSMQLLRYPISSYWLAVAMVVVVSGIPPTVIEAVDLFWRIFLLRSRAPTQQEPVAVTWTSLIWTLAILPFSDAALGEAHPDAESPEVKLHLLELRSALTRLGSRMVAVYAAFVFAAFILYIRRLEAYEDQAMRGKRQRHRTSHMGNFDTVAMSISSPTLSVSSMGSFNDHSVETHKQSRLLSHKDSPKLSTGLDKRVFEQENDVQDLGGVVAFDGGFQPRHADAEKGSLLEDLNYNDEGDSTEDKDGGFPPRRQQLFFHRMMSGVRGPSMFFQRHSGENHLGPSRLWSSPAGPPDHSGVFGLIRNFLKRWSGCSVGLHLAFHLLLGAPWAIFAVESLMGVAVVSRNTASQSAIFDNVVRPMPFINNGSVVLPSPFQVNSADGGLGQSDIGPIAVLLQPVAVSFTLAALHIVVAVILVIVSMEALPETKPPSSSSSNPNVVSSRPRRFSSSSSTSSTSSTLTGVTSLSETYGKEFDDDTGGSSLFTPDSLKIHSEAGAASFTHPSSPVVSSPLVASVVVVDPYSSVGIAETDTKADQTRRRGKRMIMPSPLLPSSFFAGPSEGSPRLQPNYGISSPKLAPSLALPSPTSMPPLLSPSAKHRVYVDGVASPAFKSDIRCFRFLNVVLLVVAALVMGLTLGWLGVCREACGRRGDVVGAGVPMLEGMDRVVGTVGVWEGDVSSKGFW